YTLAIVVRQALDPAWQATIIGIDVDQAALRQARRARYAPWALRATPTHVRQRWFRSDGRELVLDDEIRTGVRFVERNLVDDDHELWRPDAYDVVFCRNVLMYLTPDTCRKVLSRVARCLAPDGYLLLGHAETVRGLSDDFRVRQTHGTFYYQRVDPLV